VNERKKLHSFLRDLRILLPFFFFLLDDDFLILGGSLEGAANLVEEGAGVPGDTTITDIEVGWGGGVSV
jgi:hypothetical protein